MVVENLSGSDGGHPNVIYRYICKLRKRGNILKKKRRYQCLFVMHGLILLHRSSQFAKIMAYLSQTLNEISKPRFSAKTNTFQL